MTMFVTDPELGDAPDQDPALGPIRIDEYPQLKQIAWHLTQAMIELDPEEALALYERNWRHVDSEAMDARERTLLEGLIATVGNGVFLV